MRNNRIRQRLKPASKLWLALLASAMLLFTACSGDASTTAEAEPSVGNASDGDVNLSADKATEERTATSTTSADEEEEVAQSGSAAAPDGRLIRREAAIVLEVEDLPAAVEKVSNAMVGGDAYLAEESTGVTSSNLTFRVPNKDFDQKLGDLPQYGILRQQSLSSDDRTEAIVDLRARLETAEASLARTQALWEETTTVEEIIQLEGVLAEREALVASLKAQLENEERSVALSTIQVQLKLANGADTVVEEEDGLGVLDALSNGINALGAIIFTVVLVAVFLVPLSPLLIGGFFGIRWLLKRARKNRAKRIEDLHTGMATQNAGRYSGQDQRSLVPTESDQGDPNQESDEEET